MAWKDYFHSAQAAAPRQILDARDARAARRQELLARYGGTLVCFTMNLPGAYKIYPLARCAFQEGEASALRQLARAGIEATHCERREGICGCEGFYVAQGKAEHVKHLMVAVETGHPLGRLFDLDVFDAQGKIWRGEEVGRGTRGCILCGGPVWACAGGRAHAPEELAMRAAEKMGDYFAGQYADGIAGNAARALLYELCVTPKPGLVDRAGAGAHRDMDLFTLLDSGCALSPHFRAIALAGIFHAGEPETLLAAVRYAGLSAEDAMFSATAGVNAHKGLIFSMGLVCAAMGYLFGNGGKASPEALFSVCARAAAPAPAEYLDGAQDTPGRRAFARYGILGARGEAAGGFPNVQKYGYPVLCRLTAAGYSLNDAGVAALLFLMAHVDDANVVHRSDLETLREIQGQAADFLRGNPDKKATLAFAQDLDRSLTARGLSPGGCADLLALSFFVYFLFEEEAGSR